MAVRSRVPAKTDSTRRNTASSKLPPGTALRKWSATIPSTPAATGRNVAIAARSSANVGGPDMRAVAAVTAVESMTSSNTPGSSAAMWPGSTPNSETR